MWLVFSYLLQFFFFFCAVQSHPINECFISIHYAYPIYSTNHLENFRIAQFCFLAKVVFWWFWFVGWYYSVLKAFDAWVPQKRFKHWLLPLGNFFFVPMLHCCKQSSLPHVQIFVNTHSLQDIVVQKCDLCLLFNGKACNLLRSHCSSYIISCPLTFGNLLDEMDLWVISEKQLFVSCFPWG